MHDFRSDTVTRPTVEMVEAMAVAQVGDDVYADDPTVNQLEETAAAITGKQAAMFAVSGTHSNLCAILAHCHRGEEVLVGRRYHTYEAEAGGMAVLGGVFPHAIDVQQDGTLSLEALEQSIAPDDPHCAITRMISLENTWSGTPINPAYFGKVRQLAHAHSLGVHLDGARLFNACIKLEQDIATFAQYCDSVSICLSKGLCAPMGSVLVGDKGYIDKARRWRKMLGGGTRQAGYMAAAGIIALTRMPERLHQDHANAAWLAETLGSIKPLVQAVNYTGTNMVFVTLEPQYAKKFFACMRQEFLLSESNPLRLVCHKDVNRTSCQKLVEYAQSCMHNDH